MTARIDLVRKRARVSVLRRPNVSFFLVFAALFVSLGVQTLLQSKFWDLHGSTYEELRQVLGASDAGHYLEGAMQLVAGDVQSMWIYRLWPAGMMLLFAVPVALRLDAILTMAVMQAGLLALAGSLVIAIAMRNGRAGRASLFALFLIASPATTSWILASGGLFSEGFAVTFLIVAVAAFAQAAQSGIASRRRLIWMLLGLFFLACAMNIRIAFLPSVVAMALVGLFAGICVIIRSWLKRGGSKKRYSGRASAEVLGIGVATAVTVGLGFGPTVAVRFALDEPITTTSNFLNASDYTYAHRWLTSEQLDSMGAGFVREGGGNWPCLADPERCDALNPIAAPSMEGAAVDLGLLRDATLQTLVTRPVRVLAVKGPVMLRAHTSLPGSSIESYSRAGVAFWVITLAVFFLVLRDVRLFPSKSLALGSVAALALVPYALLYYVHVETRYLLPIAFAIWTQYAVAPPPLGELDDEQAATAS